jgi:diguanylate cyclase (GGDEF)-like protein
MDLERENNRLREQLQLFQRQAQENEATLKRFFNQELELLSADSLPILLHTLTEGMQYAFQIRTAQLIFHDPEHELRRLLCNDGFPEAAFPEVSFVDELDSVSPLYERLSKPWLGPFRNPEHARLFHDIPGLQSIAILPLYCRDRLAGSLNLGSCERECFTQHHAWDFLGQLASVAGVCLENTVNRERLVISGLTDPLTQLHNRRYLDRRLGEELARANRYKHPLSCLFVDADHFKQINDKHGHQVGDTVLRELASRIRSQLRASDIATRYGGEEFALLLPQTSLPEALSLAERIRLEVASHPIPLADGRSIRLTVSIGVSEAWPMPGKTHHSMMGQHLLTDADRALYLAKANGRNRIEHLAEEKSKQMSFRL